MHSERLDADAAACGSHHLVKRAATAHASHRFIAASGPCPLGGPRLCLFQGHLVESIKCPPEQARRLALTRLGRAHLAMVERLLALLAVALVACGGEDDPTNVPLLDTGVTPTYVTQDAGASPLLVSGPSA